MNKILLGVLLAFSLLFSKDFWKEDKQKHFAMSATMASVSTGLARHYGSNKFESFWIGLGSSLVIGVLKEYADGKNPLQHTEDVKDVYADAIGATAGALFSAQFTWKF